MKIKPLYLYVAAFLVALIAILIITGDKNESSVAESGMPDDAVHRGMNPHGDQPGKTNVMGHVREQLEKLEKAVNENPGDTASAFRYAEMLAAAHQSEKARGLLKNILKVDDKRVDVLLVLTLISYREGALEEAEEYTNKILKIDPGNPEANYNVGAIAAAMGDTKKAFDTWEMMADKYPDTKAGMMAKQSLNKMKKEKEI